MRPLPSRLLATGSAGLALPLAAAPPSLLPLPPLPPLSAPAPSPAPAPAPAPTPAQRVRAARVLSVRNGQELRVQLAGNELPRRVRLACLQAPRPGQVPWSQVAQRRLSTLLPVGSEVSLELRGRDVFNREVALVRRNGRDVAIPLLEEGAVFRYDGLPGGCEDLNYQALEGLARRGGLGIWGRPGGIERPWVLLEQAGDPSAEP